MANTGNMRRSLKKQGSRSRMQAAVQALVVLTAAALPARKVISLNFLNHCSGSRLVLQAAGAGM